MYRTQSEKIRKHFAKNKEKDRKISPDVWEEMWVQPEKPEIIQQYQSMMADVPSAYSTSSAQEPQRERLHQQAEKQAKNDVNSERSDVHDDR
jgi:hypothetical protein